eukprot:TRINITY_DN54605_c0_g1_i1.p1 TRINITY_DN54605_c0_g1~~TRINITY_DN54605_c0_g1_i1.p1  ORF type:complete len:336 (-),score=19.72 TRINITY_DN54605_c0_g1_i1:126-1133(-)
MVTRCLLACARALEVVGRFVDVPAVTNVELLAFTVATVFYFASKGLRVYRSKERATGPSPTSVAEHLCGEAPREFAPRQQIAVAGFENCAFCHARGVGDWDIHRLGTMTSCASVVASTISYFCKDVCVALGRNVVADVVVQRELPSILERVRSLLFRHVHLKYRFLRPIVRSRAIGRRTGDINGRHQKEKEQSLDTYPSETIGSEAKTRLSTCSHFHRDPILRGDSSSRGCTRVLSRFRRSIASHIGSLKSGFLCFYRMVRGAASVFRRLSLTQKALIIGHSLVLATSTAVMCTVAFAEIEELPPSQSFYYFACAIVFCAGAMASYEALLGLPML